MDEKEPYIDSGSLNAQKTKKKATSPDYWGEIVIDITNMTNLSKTKEGWLIVPISGWKKMSKAGNVYLSLAVKRIGANDINQVPPKNVSSDDDMNDSIPF